MIRDKKEGRKEEELWFVSTCVCSAALFVALLTTACQAPLSMEFSRQEHWNRSLFHPPGDLPNPGIKPTSLVSPALASGLFTTNTIWEAPL